MNKTKDNVVDNDKSRDLNDADVDNNNNENVTIVGTNLK